MHYFVYNLCYMVIISMFHNTCTCKRVVTVNYVGRQLEAWTQGAWANIRVWIQNTLRLQLSLFAQVIVQKCEVGQAHEWSHPISKCK